MAEQEEKKAGTRERSIVDKRINLGGYNVRLLEASVIHCDGNSESWLSVQRCQGAQTIKHISMSGPERQEKRHLLFTSAGSNN